MEPRKILMGLHAARREYVGGGLRKRDLHADPFQQFQKWFEEAQSADLVEPTAMALATCGIGNQPAVRMVLLKEVDDRGFVFYTNTRSRKGMDLGVNGNAALLFYWDVL